MKGKRLSEKILQGYGLELRPVAFDDIELLRQWRNAPKIQEMFVETYVTPEQQLLWYQEIKKSINQAHWVVWAKGVRTGYISIQGEAEGPLDKQAYVATEIYAADSEARDKLLGVAMWLMLHDVVFKVFSIPEIKALVYVANPIIKFNLQLGYQEESRQGDFIRMSLTPDAYQRGRMKFDRLFPNHEIICIDPV